MIAVHPQPEGAKDSIVTLSASPGSAPSIAIGPVTGLILVKSSAAISATFDWGLIWPPDESTVSISMLSPGATVSAGGLELSQPK